MNIEKELKELLVPTKVGSMIDNTSILYTPECAKTLGDGALLAEVMPINSRPFVWYIRVDSTYLYMAEDEQEEYRDGIHAQIEESFGAATLDGLDDDSRKEELRHWSRKEKKNGCRDYPAYSWEGGSIDILNYESFMYNFFKEWLTVSGYSCEEAKDRFNDPYLLFKKNGVEVSLYPEYIETDFKKSWEQFTYSSHTIVDIIGYIKLIEPKKKNIESLLVKDTDTEFRENFTAKTFKYPYFYYQYGKNTSYIYHCFDTQERRYVAIPISTKAKQQMTDSKSYNEFYKSFLALLNQNELSLIFTNYYSSIKDLSTIETKKLIPYL